MCFCVLAFPAAFVHSDHSYESAAFLAYYDAYCAGAINLFILSSTWLTVAMSAERWLAICHPLKSRNAITLSRTKVVIVVVFAVSAIVNLPVYWRYKMTTKEECGQSRVNVAPAAILSDKFEHSYRIAWAIFGNILPLLLLLLFNGALMRQIHKSYAMRRLMKNMTGKRQTESDASRRITLTLVSIVVMFFILVAPSDVAKHVTLLVEKELTDNFTYMTIELITNVMQTINFSANFVLYCIINPSFRRSMTSRFGCQEFETSEMAPTSFRMYNTNPRSRSTRSLLD